MQIPPSSVAIRLSSLGLGGGAVTLLFEAPQPLVSRTSVDAVSISLSGLHGFAALLFFPPPAKRQEEDADASQEAFEPAHTT